MSADQEFFQGRMQAGRSEVLGPPGNGFVFTTANPPKDITIVDIKAKDEVCEMVTVYLDATEEGGPDIARVPSGPDPSPQPFQPYVIAKLEWGMDGYQSQAEVDFCRGSAFSVTAAYVRVKAGYALDAFEGVFPPIPLAPVRTAAFVSRGTRPAPSHQGPTRTLYTIVNSPVGPATEVVGDWLQIPRFARTVSLAVPANSVPPSFPPPNYRVEIGDSQGGVINIGWMNGTNASQDVTAIELPLDARLVRVVNANQIVEGSFPIKFRLIHHLAF